MRTTITRASLLTAALALAACSNAGLRMLQYSGDMHFLLSDGRSRARGAVIVIPEDAHLRFAFLGGPVGAS